MSAVEIPIRSKLDAKGFRDLDANLARARTSAVGLGKATANAIGAGMGPAGELISQINAVAGSMDAVGARGAAMAVGVGASVAATTYAFAKLKEAIDEAAEAKKDLDRSEQGGRTTATNIAATVMKEGIQPGQQEQAMRTLESAAEAARFTGQSEEERKAIQDARDFIQSGQAETLGQQRTFERNLTPESRQAIEEQRKLEQFGGQSQRDLQAIIDRAEADRERGRKMGGVQGAQLVNESQSVINDVMPFLEAVSKAYAEELAASVKEEADKLKAETERANEALSTFFDGSFNAKAQAKPTDAITSVLSDARQRIGGSANAPILSTWKTMSDLQRQTAANTAAIARNTSRTTQPSPPVAPVAATR